MPNDRPPERTAPAIVREPPVRLNVEQASYAYRARGHAAPVFTLEATTFQARERELVAILGPNASGKSTLSATGLRRAQRRSPAASSWTVLKPAVSIARTRAQRIALVQQESPLVFPDARRRLRLARPPSARPLAVV